MNSDHPIFFLDGAENKIFLWPVLSSAAPHDVIIAQASAEIALVQLIENGTQIEMLSLVRQIQLALHWQLGMGEFAFCFLGHVLEWGSGRTTILVTFDWLNKKSR